MNPMRPGRLWLWLTLAGLLASQGFRARQQPTPDVEYRGKFVFVRIRYGGWQGGVGFRGGATWSHDYPRADQHLPRILRDLTTIDANIDGTKVLTLDDPELFKYPIAYLSEPGFWTMSERDVRNLRDYLRKGGFFIFDDFENEQIHNLEEQLRRALPEYRMIEIDARHPIFDSFFRMKSIYFPHPLVPVTPVYYGIFEDNDPGERMLAIINHNNDIAEYWEWSASDAFPVDITNEAFKLGVNYIVYGLTH